MNQNTTRRKTIGANLVLTAAALLSATVAVGQQSSRKDTAAVGFFSGARFPHQTSNCITPAQRALIQQNIARFHARYGYPRVLSPDPQPYPFVPHAGNLWDDLWTNNFVDLDSTSGVKDWNCGDWTYNGHGGHDNNLRGFAEQEVGVPVLAALDGTVVDAHDGEPDRNTSAQGQPANYVILYHGGTHYSYYWHLKKGSVAVAVNQAVKAGEQIGMVASSGSSTAPHLHFESHNDGQIYEPYAGPCRPGKSYWVNQPPIRALHLNEFSVTDVNLATWNLLDEISRTGTFVSGTRSTYFWIIVNNLPASSTWHVRYLRPNGTAAFDSGTVAFNNTSSLRGAYYWWNYILNLDVTGTWRIELSINGAVMIQAPFDVVTSPSQIVNRPPSGVTAAFDPLNLTSNNVIFCRLAPNLLDDPDYDVVRCRYQWRVRGNVVRDVTTAARSDAIPRGVGQAGDVVQCTITPSDGVAFGPSAMVQAVIEDKPPVLLNPQTIPATLPASGGNVALQVRVTDEAGATSVRADVTKPDGSMQSVNLTLKSGSATDGMWEATWNVPPNTGVQAQTYGVTFAASDPAGNVGTSAEVTFIVEPETSPPVLTNPQADPTQLPTSGGPVALHITITDATGVVSAQADITKPDSSKETVALTLKNGSATNGTWEGTWNAPANTGAQAQTYRVTFSAKDAIGNTGASTEVTFVVNEADTIPPVLTSPQSDPGNLPSSGGEVTLRATVTDNKGVTSTQAEVTKPDGSKQAVALTLKSGSATNGTWEGTWNALANVSAQTQTYRVIFSAQDANGNRGQSSEVTFTVSPDTPPVLTNPQAAPASLPANGGTVTLRVTVADDLGVTSTQAEVTKPDGSKVTVNNLTRKDGSATNGTWEGKFTAPANTGRQAQTYKVTFLAMDAAGNEGQSGEVTFTVTPDTGAPVLTSPQVNPSSLPDSGGAVTLKVVVTDDTSITSAQAEVTKPDGSKETVNLLFSGGNPTNGTFEEKFTVPANTGVQTQTYKITFFAKDGLGNEGKSSEVTLTVAALPDTTAPNLSNPKVNPTNLTKDGGSVNLTVDATDNVGVQSVWAEVTKPDNTKQTINLALQRGNTYTGTFNAPANTTNAVQTYRVVFNAKDNVGNPATPTGAVEFTVAAAPDTTKPTLSNPKVNPTTLNKEGGTVNLSVEATDNVGVQSVWAEVTKPDNTKQTVNLSLQSGNTYTGTFNAPANTGTQDQTYKVTFSAKDTANNPAGPTSPVEFIVGVPYTVASASVSPSNLTASGGAVTISATLNGSQGTVNLMAKVTKGSGKKAKTVATITLTQQSGKTYTGTWNAPSNTSKKAVIYNVTVSLNNGTPVSAGSVTVEGKKKGGKRQGVLEDDEDDALKIGVHTPLTLHLLSTTGGKGGAATVFTFTLNKPAQVTARVLSPTGKAVRQFGLRQATAGLNSLIWDGKAQIGGSVARGVYLIEIVAQDEKGQAARAARMIVVR